MKHGVKGVARKLMAFLMTAMLLVSVVGMVPVSAKEAKPYLEDVQEFIKDLYENGSKPFKKGTKEPGNYYSTLNGKSNGKRKVTVRQNGKVRTYWNSSGSTQCLSFGKRAFDEIWYRYSSDAIQVKCKIKASKINDRIQWMKTNLQVGDYIRYCGHSAIVYDITDDYIELYDNNHDGDIKTHLWKQYWNHDLFKQHNSEIGVDCVYHHLKKYSSEDTLLYVRSEAVKDGIEHRPGPGPGSGSGSGTDLKDGVYYLSPKCASDLRLDVDGGDTENGTNVQVWSKNTSKAQRWYIKSAGDGYKYIISGVGNKEVLDVDNGKAVDSTNVQIWELNESASAQKWKFERTEDGYWYIYSKVGNNMVLDDLNAATEKGSNIGIYHFIGSDAQKWELIPVSNTISAKLDNLTATNITANSAKLTATCSFEGLDPSAIGVWIAEEGGKYRTAGYNKLSSKESPFSFSYDIKDLKPGTTYKYVFFVETALSVLTGDPYESEVMWFTTKSSGSVSYKIGIIHDTDGGLWLNKTASTKYPLVVIPEGAECKVYPEKKSGKWVWVEYNGYEGYAYSTYIKYN